MLLARRNVLKVLTGLLAAPAVVKIEALMPVRSIARFLDDVGMGHYFDIYDIEGALMHRAPVNIQPDGLMSFDVDGVQFPVSRTTTVSHMRLRTKIMDGLFDGFRIDFSESDLQRAGKVAAGKIIGIGRSKIRIRSP